MNFFTSVRKLSEVVSMTKTEAGVISQVVRESGLSICLTGVSAYLCGDFTMAFPKTIIMYGVLYLPLIAWTRCRPPRGGTDW